MVAVALIGVDGAGKTTMSRRLAADPPAPLTTIYMGTSVQSANYALPTTRLILWLKRRAHGRQQTADPGGDAPFVEHPPRRRGALGATLSLVNQLAEEWYRMALSWWFQARGRLVLYDRFFLFEHAIPRAERECDPPRFTDRIHLWVLDRLYPKPHLTIFLDAPVEVLQQRKKEQSLARLRRHRDAALEIGARLPGFVRVDATADVDTVFAVVRGHIEKTWAQHRRIAS